MASGANIPTGVCVAIGSEVGEPAGVAVGAAVGLSGIGAGSRVEACVAVASGVGVFAGSGDTAAMGLGDEVSVGSGVGVASVQAEKVVSNAKSAMIPRRKCLTWGVLSPLGSGVHSTCCLSLSSRPGCQRSRELTCRSRYLNLVYPVPAGSE